jgi:uncharacterized protein (DUF58 family)
MPGDPLRRIHWRQTARTGQLTVIEFEETQSIDLKIVLDTAAEGVVGDEPNTSLEYAIRAAATIARDSIQNSAMVELIVASRTGENIALPWNGLTGERGDSRLYKLLDVLARVQPQSSIGISDLLGTTIDSAARGATLVIICIHPDKDLVLMLARCLASDIGVTLIYVDSGSFSGANIVPPLNRIDPVLVDAAALGVAIFTLSWNLEGALHIIPLD